MPYVSIAPVLFRTQGQQAWTEMALFDPQLNTIPSEAQDKFIDNVYRTINDFQGGAKFTNFFSIIQQELQGVGNAQNITTKLRFKDIIWQKLKADYVNDNSLGSYAGGMSEILDAVQSLGRQGPARVAIPEGNKTYNLNNWMYPNKSVTPHDLLSQDIDRTEVHGTTKYYIEVKMDSATAVHKISTCSVKQLEGILSVIRNRTERHYSLLPTDANYKRCNKNNYDLEPAISITFPDNWLIILTSGVVKLYYDREFNLMIDGLIIGPNNLKKLYRNLWELLKLPGKPLNYFDLNKQQNNNIKQALKSFYDQKKTSFPAPRLVAQQNFALAGFNLVPPPPPP